MAPGLAQAGLLRGRTVDQLLAALEPVGRMEDALRDADYVQESTPERLDSKRRVYAELDRLAPAGAILASSTSALLPSHFTADLPAARVAGGASDQSAVPVPAVEIVPAPWTDAACVERARSLLAEAGQQPIVMRREIDGFVVNRLQGALLHEAFRLVADGYAGVEDVDTCIRDGLALRWAFMGPFETIDLNAPAGVRDYAERYEGMYAEMFESMTRRVPWSGATLDRVEAQRREHLPADGLAQRQIWRDLRLMELAAHKERLRQGGSCLEPHSLSDC